MNKLARKLHARQLVMIALGGSIGTGLFLASGLTISQVGPVYSVIAYSIIGILVYFIMTSLGEMAALVPTSGSFYAYGTRFVEPSLGYALGINYWFSWAITVAAEISAAAVIMKFWFPHTPPILWSVSFLLILFLINYLSVKGFGEVEYVLSWIKVAIIILFIIIGALFIAHSFYEHGVAKVIHRQLAFHGDFLSLIGVFMIVGYSFQGTELVGIAAGESENPHQTIPLAIKKVFWRIILFYICTMIIIGLIIPYNAESLARGDVLTSPFTLVFERSGIPYAASLMNAVILVAVLSAGNSAMYASTRMLAYLAKKNHAPKIFSRINKRGVPINALFLSTVAGMVAFLSFYISNDKVYAWLINASGMAGFIVWFGIAISHFRFRRAYIAQGRSLADLPYRAKFYPFGPILAGTIFGLIILGQDFSEWSKGHLNWYDFVSTYCGLFLFLGIFLYHRLRFRTKTVPLLACDFSLDSDEKV